MLTGDFCLSIYTEKSLLEKASSSRLYHSSRAILSSGSSSIKYENDVKRENEALVLASVKIDYEKLKSSWAMSRVGPTERFNLARFRPVVGGRYQNVNRNHCWSGFFHCRLLPVIIVPSPFPLPLLSRCLQIESH